LSVADNARDAVFVHVSASNERQECGNETGAIAKTTERQIVIQGKTCGNSSLCFYTLELLIVKVKKHITPTHVNIIIFQSHFSSS
jgi:hypothetical protein